MNPTMALGALLGVSLGTGLWILLSMIPRIGAVPLHERVAPYVADISATAFDDVTRRRNAWAGYGRGPVAVRAAMAALAERLPYSSSVALNLHRSGSTQSEREFRTQRVVWSMVGLIAGLAFVAVLTVISSPAPMAWFAVPAAASALSYTLVGYRLQVSASRRVRRLEEELPAVWEFIALCVTAGESLPDALRRIVAIGHGPAVDELRQCVLAVESGVPLASALSELSRRLQLASLSRGIEQILSAISRGTPLAAVLQDQAVDAREDAKRRLLESAGKKEVAMLVPLVFLILPVTILFAVFPGLVVIQAGF